MKNQELKHFGIPGMRWGVRRGRNVSTGSRPKKLKAKNLTDAELRTKITRMQMENQYNQLSRPKLERGKKIVTGVLLGMATVRATKVLNTAADKGAVKVGKAATELFLKARNSLIPNF